MPEAIESRTFRSAARKNCVLYLGIPIYVSGMPEFIKMALPTFRAQTPEGAASQLFSTLVNMGTQIEQIRQNMRMTDSKPVPGVSYGEAESLSMSLNGAVYFEDARQYAEFLAHIKKIGQTYGWAETVSEKMSTAVYRPAQNKLTNIDPVQAAVKGMVLGTMSDVMDAGTLLAATDSIKKGSAEEGQYFAARDRYLGGSIFNVAAIQYYSNTPRTVQNSWQDLGDEMIPALLIDGEAREIANIAYAPTSLSIAPGAFVVDSSGYYPTRYDISIQMSNPLGGLFANFAVAKDGEGGEGAPAGVTPTTPSNYIPGQGG